MNALEAFSEHRPHPEEHRTLSRPISRRSAAVHLPRNHHQVAPAFRGAALRPVENGDYLTASRIERPASQTSLRELVAQFHVGECAAHHHFMVAATAP